MEYKRAILHHDVAKILRTTIRIALPAMAIPKNERNAHDEGVIRLVLILFRNIALTEQPKDLPSSADDAEVSRSTTIDAFHAQDVLQLILTVSSSIGEEFIVQDVDILELLFHLLKGINPDNLFMEEEQLAQDSITQFQTLVSKEKAMLAGYKRYAPSRHNRFGTMVWLKRGDDRLSTISGQEIIHSTDTAMRHMDKSKKWNKPKHRGKRDPDKERDSSDFNKFINLTPSARKSLKRFVGEFLDSSFNPLFTHLRKAIEREVERVRTDMHSMQFFYLVGWFLQAECARRRYHNSKKVSKGKNKAGATTSGTEEDSFGLVGSVLNQETFVLLNRFMQSSHDNKEWKELNAGMRCFSQIVG